MAQVQRTGSSGGMTKVLREEGEFVVLDLSSKVPEGYPGRKTYFSITQVDSQLARIQQFLEQTSPTDPTKT
jgi:hypothetical protein